MANLRSRCTRKRGFGAAFAGLASLAALAFVRPAPAQTETVPPPTSVEYLQYGVSLHTLTLLDSGAVCSDEENKACILGSGGGLGLRMGYVPRPKDGGGETGKAEAPDR